MNNRRAFLLTAGSAVMTVATIGLSRSALASSTFKTTSLMVSLNDVFFYPPQPMLNFPGEPVTLGGDVHVVTAWPPDPFNTAPAVNIYLNMAGMQGTGQTTNNLYIGTGAQNFLNTAFPPEPVFVANFALEPTNGLASVPLPLSVSLVFDSDGNLLPSSTVSVFVPK